MKGGSSTTHLNSKSNVKHNNETFIPTPKQIIAHDQKAFKNAKTDFTDMEHIAFPSKGGRKLLKRSLKHSRYNSYYKKSRKSRKSRKYKKTRKHKYSKK